MLTACTGTRHLQPEEALLGKSKLDYVDAENIKRSQINPEINKALADPSNTKVIWMRPALAIYNSVREPKKEKGIRNYLKNRLGQEPVLYSDIPTANTADRIQKTLNNEGYFNAEVQAVLSYHRKEIRPTYRIVFHPPYRIGTFTYNASQTHIDDSIQTIVLDTPLKQGKRYSLQQLIDERKRIGQQLNNKGFYHFKPEFLEYIIDSGSRHHQLDIQLRIKPEINPEYLQAMRIKSIQVIDDYRLNTKHPYDTANLDGIEYLTITHPIKPTIVLNTLHLRPGDYYAASKHVLSLNHFNELHTFKYSNLVFTPVDEQHLHAVVTLVPANPTMVYAELDASIKSNHNAGPGIKLSINRRNLFRGAELLNLNLGGQFETQINASGNISYELNAEANLLLPRLFPFKYKQVTQSYLPSSTITTSAVLSERYDYYKMLTLNTSLKYSWRRNKNLYWGYNPIDINLSNLLSTTERFNDFLQQNPSVLRSFEEQFIVGSGVYANYNKPTGNPLFFGVQVDGSGNYLNLLQHIVGNPPADSPQKLFNEIYAQFLRIQSEYRYRQLLPLKVELATRFFTGVGVPYHNSQVMPYIKQFSVGGTNSLRGFAARSIGPGTYKEATEGEALVFTDQTGDIKIESNIEFRHPIWGFIKGAFFADAGNVWLARADSLRPGAEFGWSDFAHELAVSAGYGIRIDFSPLVIRLDTAWPFRYPYQKNGRYWQMANFDFGNPEWRRNNLILNISLGYPF